MQGRQRASGTFVTQISLVGTFDGHVNGVTQGRSLRGARSDESVVLCCIVGLYFLLAASYLAQVGEHLKSVGRLGERGRRGVIEVRGLRHVGVVGVKGAGVAPVEVGRALASVKAAAVLLLLLLLDLGVVAARVDVGVAARIGDLIVHERLRQAAHLAEGVVQVLVLL